MANREALRELQSRLASRLQAAKYRGRVKPPGWRWKPRVRKLPAFRWRSPARFFLLPALSLCPTRRAWFLGVANLRGGLYGVVDLASFVAGRAPGLRSDATRAESRLVALNALLEVNCALLIDRVGWAAQP